MRKEVTVRELVAEDLAPAWELGRLAFGAGPEPPPHALTATPGIIRYGAFDAGGRLLGKAADLYHEQWWSGRTLTAAGVAGVAVLPEARGRGVARLLLTEILRGARERGAAVSALYPTIAAPYRSCGWEVCGTMRTVDLPTAALPRHRPAPDLSVRPGGRADLPAVMDLYQEIVRHRCGLLSRRGELFDTLAPSDSLPSGIDGLTLVERGDQLLGYATWERGQGYDAASVLTVHDLLARTADAARELVGLLARWQSVAPTVRLRLLPHDAVSVQLPLEIAREHRQQTWMHRPVDIVPAVEGRGWPEHVRGGVEFSVEDEIAPWNGGSWRLEVTAGAARLERIAGTPALALTTRGFAMLYAGVARAATVADAGLLRCQEGADPTALDLLGAGEPAHLLDYF